MRTRRLAPSVAVLVVMALLATPAPAFAETLRITEPSSPMSGTVTVPFSYPFTERPGTGVPPYRFRLHPNSGPLPAGLALAENGLLSGTPTAMGTWIFRVMVIDGNSATASTGQITFNVGVLPMGLAPPPPTTVTGLTNTAHQFMATGGMPPYTYTKSGTLPVGMTVTQGGLLTGYPHTGGTFTFSVQAKDVLNASVTQTYTFTVVPPKITSGAPGPAEIGKPYSHTFTTTPGRIGTVTFERLTGFIPPGLSLTSAGVLNGTPTSLGTFTFIVHATFKVSTYTFDNYQQVTVAVTPPPTTPPPTTPVATTRPPDAQSPNQSSATTSTDGTATSTDGTATPDAGAPGPAEPEATLVAGGTVATSGDMSLLWWLILVVIAAVALAIWLLRRHRTPSGDQP